MENKQKEALKVGKIKRENDIKALNARGLSTGQIAKALNIAESVVVRVLNK